MTDDASLNVQKINAILVTDIQYTCIINGIKFIPANTLIEVDIENNIALIENTHIHIDSHEYLPLYS